MTGNLTVQKLYEAVSQIDIQKETLTVIYIPKHGNEELKLRTILYTPTTPNTVLARFRGVKVIVSNILPDNMIALLYEDRDGNVRGECKIIDWGK